MGIFQLIVIINTVAFIVSLIALFLLFLGKILKLKAFSETNQVMYFLSNIFVFVFNRLFIVAWIMYFWLLLKF